MDDTIKTPGCSSINSDSHFSLKEKEDKGDKVLNGVAKNCGKGGDRGINAVSNTQVQQLFARLTQEINENHPRNVIYFVVDFLCKHYPEHLQGFAAVMNGDPELERERLTVVEFFKAQKLPSEIATHFTNAGFDTLETLCTLTSESLDDIERFNQTRWLPGHKVRLQQTFSDIATRVKVYREEKEALLSLLKNQSFCHHPTAIAKANLIPNVLPSKYDKCRIQNSSTHPTLPTPSFSGTYHYDYSAPTSYPKSTYMPYHIYTTNSPLPLASPISNTFYSSMNNSSNIPFVSNSLASSVPGGISIPNLNQKVQRSSFVL